MGELEQHVDRVPNQEQHDGDEHADGRDPEAPPPSHVPLDVQHHREVQQHGETHGEEVEVLRRRRISLAQ